MKHGFGLLVALFVCVNAWGGASTDNLENAEWNAKKAPSPVEPPLKASSKEAWTKSGNGQTQAGNDCATQAIWRFLPTSKINVTALKEIKVPVKATFDRFNGFVFADKKTSAVSAGQGAIDLTSYDSGSEPRDRRVQRYVLDAEKPGNEIATFSFTFNKGFTLPSKKSAVNGEVDADLVMNGNHYRMNFPVKATRISDASIELVSQRIGSFTYINDQNKPRVLEMMKQCNHHYLSSFVNVSFQVMLEDICKKGTPGK